MSSAMVLEPNSFALQFLGSRVYAIATTSREIVGNERQEFLEKSLVLARSALALEPQSIEAREEVIVALHDLGRLDEEEKATQELARDDNPPEVQMRAYLGLVMIYDEKDERSEALIAARKAEQISEVVDALTATTENDLIFSSMGMIGREELAAREEEAGEYVQAASDYEATRSFAKPGLYYDAVFFKIDMGLARSLRRTGQSRAADNLCDHWRHRATGKIHILGGPDRGGAAFDWGGSDVAGATWDFSCGNFDKGVEELIDIAQSRLQKPADKWGEGSVEFYLRAPLDVLELAFLAHGSSQLALQTRAILKLEEDPSISHLDEALKQVEGLKESFITGNP